MEDPKNKDKQEKPKVDKESLAAMKAIKDRAIKTNQIVKK